MSWNLLSVFRTPAKLKAIEAHGQMLDAQSLALSLSILTEVHVGAAQFVQAKEEYQDAWDYATLMASLGEEAVPASMGEHNVAQLADSIKQYWESSGFTMSGTERRSEVHAIPVAQ